MPHFPYLYSEGDDRTTGGAHLEIIRLANRGARRGRYVADSMLGAGDTVVNTTSQSLLSGHQNMRGSQGQDCPEMFKPLLEIHGLCDTGMPGASWGRGNREGLVAWRQPHLLPTVFLGPSTPSPPPQLPASEGTSEPTQAPGLPLPGARCG